MDFSRAAPKCFADAGELAHEIIIDQTGLDDFGPADYLPGLRVLLQSMDFDPHFSEAGRQLAWAKVVALLRSRAHAIQSMKENPGFDAVPVISPVVIVGVPRTGTTALHRLMAVDDRFQGMESWLLDAPMPRPPVETWPDYPQFRATAAWFAAEHERVPQRQAAHFRSASEVHECCIVLRQSFVSNTLSCAWPAASYDAWWQCQSEEPAYRHYHRCVQLIGMNDPDRRWLLKNPGHIEHLDLLFAVFPDARVIQTHRDPARAVPSLVSLLMMMHPQYEDGRFEERGRIMLRRETAKWANAVRKSDAVRARFPGQVLDVVHGDFHRNPMGTLERIYGFIGMEISDELRPKLESRIAEKPELKRGSHRYDIADYAMSEEEVREQFGDYVERFELIEQGR